MHTRDVEGQGMLGPCPGPDDDDDEEDDDDIITLALCSLCALFQVLSIELI